MCAEGVTDQSEVGLRGSQFRRTGTSLKTKDFAGHLALWAY
jgi:hypothetical protein